MKLENVISLMDQIINDRTVPRNIRRAVEESKNALNGNDPPEVKLSTAISILDEIINDPNMPIYARTKIWNIVSMLEEMRRELG